MPNQKTLFDDDQDEVAMAPVRKDAPSMHTLADLIKVRANTSFNKYVSREYQDFGVRLAMELDDEAHKSLYIRMAKTYDRKILEQARTFVIDSNADSKARLFMWKVKQLKDKGNQSTLTKSVHQ